MKLAIVIFCSWFGLWIIAARKLVKDGNRPSERKIDPEIRREILRRLNKDERLK